MRESHLSYYGSYLKSDIRASIVVFLVAVPLALGIALASGAPLFSGLISAIVGGLVVTLFSGSQVSVSGPAAGLAVIVFMAIETLGSFNSFLVAVILAGILQIGMGYLKAGTIGAFFPSSVIKAMLAAIGIILIMKQVPHALGYDDRFFGDESYMRENMFSSVVDFFNAFAVFTPAAAAIAFLSLVTMIIWDKSSIKNSFLGKYFPGALVVVILGVITNMVLQLIATEWALGQEHLVSLPEIHSFGDFVSLLQAPDWSVLGNSSVYSIALTIALIASIETLLSIEAADKIDPLKRVAPTNRELKAQGMGNIVSGLLGGLPVTAVIVRSSTNVYNGGKTKVSAFMHGVWLLISVLFFAAYLNYIPLASLAAILLFVGYKLATPELFKTMWRQGYDQFIPFIVTIIAILITDLLMGIGIGMAVGVFFVIKTNYHQAITMNKDGNRYTILLNKNVNFLNKAILRKYLSQVEEGGSLVIDGRQAQFIDHDILETIEDYLITSKENNIYVENRLFVDIVEKNRYA